MSRRFDVSITLVFLLLRFLCDASVGAELGLADLHSVRKDGEGAEALVPPTPAPAGSDRDRTFEEPPVLLQISDRNASPFDAVPSTNLIRPAMFQPEFVPEPVVQTPSSLTSPTTTQPSFRDLRAAFGRTIADRERLSVSRRSLVFGPSIDVVDGRQSKVLPVSFSGSLFGKSSSVSGVQSIRRSPIVSDTRLRGKRAGQTLASGSFWVPARRDLDTMLSKIDARLIEDIVVVKGPYSVLYGPGLDFFDVQLRRTSRFSAGSSIYGSTSLDYQTNGQHWYGRESIWGGSDNWGFHVGYGHRTANDYESGNGTAIPASFKARDLFVALGYYESGNGTAIPASFKARDLFVALGYDFDEDRTLEFNFLRLDETDVEFPGQVFDMDFLVTDGFELQYTDENREYVDRLTLDAWYNRTRFAGQAQRAGKRRQFPILDTILFHGVTDVDSMSTGFRFSAMWEPTKSSQFIAGVDFRFLNQELNEITSADIVVDFWIDANSPIPASHWSNPGLFAQWTSDISEQFKVRAGVRTDWVSTNVDADEDELAELGGFVPGFQPTFAEIVGSDDFDRSFALWAAYASSELKVDDRVTILASAGQAQRAPTLTELYAAEPFMFLLQNGLNTVTGDPRLDLEREWQIDLGVQYKEGCVSLAVNGFHTWVFDFITFENLGVEPALASPEQVQLKFVNTDFATLSGVEFKADCDLTDCLSMFAALAYVEGWDRSRNGKFATVPVGGANQPSVQVSGSRGDSSGVTGPGKEPLPGILPFDSQIGFRLHPPNSSRRWTVEISTRIVDGQDRVAASLLEQSTPGFTVWNLRSFWHVNEALTVMGGVENIGDRNYREHLDYRPITAGSSLTLFQPGASFYFGGELSY